MAADTTQFEDGSVVVKVRSKRGTGTRDQDEVTVEAYFDSIAAAESESARLNDLVQDRLFDARTVGGDGRDRQAPGAGDDHAASAYSKIYLGSGAGMRGWIPVATDVIEDEIVPLVDRFEVDDDADVAAVSVNFTSDVSISGWHDVDAGVVTRKIEPIVKRNMIDIENED
jgi:hypothetical protein